MVDTWATSVDAAFLMQVTVFVLFQDTLYRVYTYSRDLENGLCDRHKKAEVVRLNEFQKQDPGSLETSYKGTSYFLVFC